MIAAAARAALIAALACAVTAQAQIVRPPDAGGQLRDQEKKPPVLPGKPPPRPEVEAPARAPLRAAPAVRFTLLELRVSGNSAFSAEELKALVADLIGRETGFAELEEAAARITRHYRERGYLVARAYLPAQEIRDGVVEVAVLEGRLGKVELQNRSRVSDETVQGYFDGIAGGVIREDRLERKLLLLYDLAGVAPAGAALRPGERVGESALALGLAAPPAATERSFTGAGLELDNYGSYYSGEWRISGRLEVASPAGLGELLSAELIKGMPGLDMVRLGYQLPIGADGLRAAIGYSALHYELGKDFAALGANGRADSASATLSYPLLRSRTANFSAQLGYTGRRFVDRFDAFATSTEKHTDVGTLGVSGDWLDALLGGSANVWSLGASAGVLDIETPAAFTLDDATLRTHGSFAKLGWSVLRAQRIGGAWSAQLAFSGQRASRNLDSSEKFSLGGPYGVRAFPLGEGSGDDAALASAELRLDLEPGGLQLVAFLDGGTVRINHEPLAGGGQNERNLAAAGFGMILTHERAFSARAMVAWGNERSTAAPDRRPRGWLQIAYRL